MTLNPRHAAASRQKRRNDSPRTVAPKAPPSPSAASPAAAPTTPAANTPPVAPAKSKSKSATRQPLQLGHINPCPKGKRPNNKVGQAAIEKLKKPPRAKHNKKQSKARQPCAFGQLEMRCKHCKGAIKHGVKASRPKAGYVFSAPAIIARFNVTAGGSKGQGDTIKLKLNRIHGSCSQHPRIKVLEWQTPHAYMPKVLCHGKNEVSFEARAFTHDELRMAFARHFSPQAARRYAATLATCAYTPNLKRSVYNPQTTFLYAYPNDAYKLALTFPAWRKSQKNQTKQFNGSWSRETTRARGRDVTVKGREVTVKSAGSNGHKHVKSLERKEWYSYQHKGQSLTDTTKTKVDASGRSKTNELTQASKSRAGEVNISFSRTSGSNQTAIDLQSIKSDVQTVVEAFSDFSSALDAMKSLKFGYYMEANLTFLAGGIEVEWGYKEGHQTKDGAGQPLASPKPIVFWQRAARAKLTLISGYFELGIGAQLYKAVAKLYCRVDAAAVLSGTAKVNRHPNSSPTGVGEIELAATSSGTVGLKAEIGKIITADGRLTTGMELRGKLVVGTSKPSLMVSGRWTGVSGQVTVKVLWGLFSRNYKRNPIHPAVRGRDLFAVNLLRLKAKKKTGG